jgi:hypothetical protein
MAGSKSSLSRAETLEEMGEFWDSHDFTDFDSSAPVVEFTVASAVSVEPDLFSAIEEQAKMRDVTVETLVNLWLKEKLAEEVSLSK